MAVTRWPDSGWRHPIDVEAALSRSIAGTMSFELEDDKIVFSIGGTLIVHLSTKNARWMVRRLTRLVAEAEGSGD